MKELSEEQIDEALEEMAQDYKTVANFLDGNISHGNFLTMLPLIFLGIFKAQEMDLETIRGILDRVKSKTLDICVEDGIE